MGLGPPGGVEEVLPQPGIGFAEVLQQALTVAPGGTANAVSRLPMTSLNAANVLSVIVIVRSSAGLPVGSRLPYVGDALFAG